MGDRITVLADCPKCGGKGTFECYEALSSLIKHDECVKCNYVVKYEVTDDEDYIRITEVDKQEHLLEDTLTKLENWVLSSTDEGIGLEPYDCLNHFEAKAAILQEIKRVKQKGIFEGHARGLEASYKSATSVNHLCDPDYIAELEFAIKQVKGRNSDSIY